MNMMRVTIIYLECKGGGRIMPPYIYARTLSLFSLIVVQNQTFSRDSLKVTSKLIIALYLNKINCSIECVKSKDKLFSEFE